MLWVDKHRPKSLEDLDIHDDITRMLDQLGATRDFPHLLFYGPSGAGKKTRVMALLRKQFGESVFHVKLEHKTIEVTDSKSIDIATLSSPHHIDVNPSDAGNYDRVIVMSMIREMAETAPMVTTSGEKGKFKVVVLSEADKMTRAAQQALRRTMEKYMATCRLILIATSLSRLIAPLKSRCVAIRIPGHSASDIGKVCVKICAKESIESPGSQFLAALADKAGGNLRRAVLLLEASKMKRANFAGDGQDIPQADWKQYTQEIGADMMAEQTPKRLYECRQKYYELLGMCVPPDIILREVVHTLVRSTDPRFGPTIASLAAEYDHYLKLGSKPIIHLEAFTAQVMKSLKEFNGRL